VRNAALHRHLERYTVDAAGHLAAGAASGVEIPFELAEEPGAGASLYRYRPLTGAFVRAHHGSLSRLASYEPAARALAECDALDVYLSVHGEVRMPGDRWACAELALELFLAAMFGERTEFGFEPAHFEAGYGELERTVYSHRGAATVIAPVLGLALDARTTELTLGDGLSLIHGEALAGAPREAVWGEGEDPNVLAVLTVEEEHGRRGAVPLARTRFRRLLSALRLFERGTYAIGPMAWAQTDGGGWRPAPLGMSGRIGGIRLLTLVPSDQEEELRAFYRLVSRRGAPAGGGELAWALARFEMGCERPVPLEALTDHLLALRALLEPEGPASGRLAQRLAVICAQPQERATLARRTARAVALERAVITGMAGLDEPGSAAQPRAGSVDGLVDELAGHLRAILRDALCGHLQSDLVAVANELLAEAADESDDEDLTQAAAGRGR
jgi:hypothetical protein